MPFFALAVAVLLVSVGFVAVAARALGERSLWRVWVWRNEGRLMAGDQAYARTIVQRLTDAQPPPRSDQQTWAWQVVGQARLLAHAKFFTEALTLLDLLSWDALLYEQLAPAAATRCACQLARGDVAAARAALALGDEAPAKHRDPAYRMLALRLMTYEPFPIRELERFPDTRDLVSSEPSLRVHDLAFRAHGAAARHEDDAARLAIAELVALRGRDRALQVLSVPEGPATGIAQEACGQGYR